jgi:hypothetical protein
MSAVSTPTRTSTIIRSSRAERPDPDALAKRFGTSVNHIHQAVAYAARAGFLGAAQ